MPAVTAITRQPRRRRFNIYVDGVFALALEPDVLAASGLAVGVEVNDERLPRLAEEDRRRRALDGALRLLAVRPRSEKELRDRLARAGHAPDVVNGTIARLRDLGYVDDAAFSRAWAAARSAGNAPRGRRLIRRELAVKGIDAELAGAATSTTDEAAAARRAAEKRARTLRGLPYPDFRNRLAGYLARRGFDYDTIRPIVADLWRAATGAPPDDDGAGWEPS